MSSYRMSREPNDRKVFIGDLPRDIRREELRDICEKYGRVMDVWLARKPPGFGFVEFDDKRDANDAVRDLDGQKVFGRRVRAEISTDRSRRGAGGPKSDARCYECNDRGHYARECRERQRKRSRRDRSYSRDRSPSVRRHRSRSRSRRPARRSSRSSERSSEQKQTARRRRSASRKEVSRSRSASRPRRSVSKRRSESRHRSASRGKERSPSRHSRSSSKGRPSRSPSPKREKRRKRSRSRSGSANGYDKKRGGSSVERASHGKNSEWN